MQNILKLTLMTLLIVVSFTAILLVLDVIQLDVAKDAIYKTVLVILIIAVTSIAMYFLGGGKKH